MKNRKAKRAAVVALIITVFPALALAGLIGPPQPVSRKDGGLHTGIGYWHHEDKLKDGRDYTLKQNQLYTHAGYGSGDLWEIYGRIGISDVKLQNAFSPTQSATTSSKTDLEDNWNNFFGTLGAKIFTPVGRTFGLGAFAQGTWFFNDFSDSASGTRNGSPFISELKIKELWDVNFGIAFQATVMDETRLYAGPYLYYSEAKISPSANIPGLQFTGDETLKSKSNAGGFAGVDTPLGKGFRANIEAQFSDRVSIGGAITFTY